MRYEVTGRPLKINGCTHAKGSRVSMSTANAAALLAAGRLRIRSSNTLSVNGEPIARVTKTAPKKVKPKTRKTE